MVYDSSDQARDEAGSEEAAGKLLLQLKPQLAHCLRSANPDSGGLPH